MNKQDAELVARVALRIGAHTDCVQEHGDGWAAIVTWSKDGGFHVFDPAANPADERRVWDWLGLRYSFRFRHSPHGQYLLEIDGQESGRFENSCVTALLMAIDALPEGGV